MNMITVRVVDELYFTAAMPCGKSWPGMRHSNDVSIVLDRAMDHLETCTECRGNRTIKIDFGR